MTSGEKHHPDREIINRWVIVKNNPGIENILAGKGLKHHNTNGCIGFFYVDHAEGISLRVRALCRIEPGKPPQVVVNSDDVGEDFIFRYGEVEEFTLLTNEEAEELSLLEEQRWLSYYEPPRLHDLRKRVDLDQFRAPGYFDDVSVVLRSNDQEHIPEVVWVCLEEILEDGKRFRGKLLNEPDADFGVHAGDTLTVCFIENEEGRYLVAETGMGVIE